MQLITINQNILGQNIYLYFDEASKEGVIIDPGDSADIIETTLKEHNIKVKGILLTHSHYDHITSAIEIRALTKADIYCHVLERPMLEDPEYNLSVRFTRRLEVSPDKVFADGDEFPIGETTLKVIHTPGHTPGGLCYYDKKNRLIFTGDTLFHNSIGRSDFPYGEYDVLIASIKQRLFTLPDYVKIYPGHGGSSTIGDEKTSNPFVK